MKGNTTEFMEISERKFIKYDFVNSENFIDNTYENFHLEF